MKKKKIIFNYFTQYDQEKLEKGIFCPKQWVSGGAQMRAQVRAQAKPRG